MTAYVIGKNTLHIDRESKTGSFTSLAQYNSSSTTIDFNSLSLEEVTSIIKAATELREILVAELVAKACKIEQEA